MPELVGERTMMGRVSVLARAQWCYCRCFVSAISRDLIAGHSRKWALSGVPGDGSPYVTCRLEFLMISRECVSLGCGE